MSLKSLWSGIRFHNKAFIISAAGTLLYGGCSLVYEQTRENKYQTVRKKIPFGNISLVNYRNDSFMFPDVFEIDRIRLKFKVPSHCDVVVSSFPKSGTTWVQNIVLQLYDQSLKENLDVEFPFLENIYPSGRELIAKTKPRFIKTHLPYSYLNFNSPNKTKIVYIYRQPVDTIVSYYHFLKSIPALNIPHSLLEFAKDFYANQVPYAPWTDHVASYVAHSDDSNMLIMTYEELHSNSSKSISKLAKFLDIKLTDEKLRKIVEATKFDNMKKDGRINYKWLEDSGYQDGSVSTFMRGGRIGDGDRELPDFITSKVKERFNDDAVREKVSLMQVFR